ncbi:MAG TPA: DUF2167 domain-containing protein [Chitinophagaceae bacterium]|jgi:uncharacterized membrane-anchored protein|nr:DUF2167 domain-containing protein [Chitinophagaceae bacterium]
MRSLFLALFCAASLLVRAGDPVDSLELKAELTRIYDSIESRLHYKTGSFTLADGLATIKVPKGFKFLEASEARYVIEEVWGNQKGQIALGLIFPDSSSATSSSFAFVVEYEAMGYVKDSDADDIDYAELLTEMKAGNKEANEQRIKEGLTSMELIGWAATPFYDKNKKVLHWAKEIRVADQEEHILNYDIRVLGRKGVLILQAVSDMSALPSVNANIDNMLNMVSFSEGNRYSDFDSSTDEVAAWTIGGLVAGKVLAKAGFFAVIMKFFKFIVLGAIALGGALIKFFRGRKKQEEEEVYTAKQEPTPAPVTEEQQG